MIAEGDEPMAKRKVQPIPGDGTYGNGRIEPRGKR
jgi:hypothetical protein